VPERLWPRLASAIGMHARSGTQCVFESAGFRWSWSQLELWGVSLAPLYYASHGGHAATVEWLLGEKARVDHSNAYGCAPRHPHGAALIILAVLCASRSCAVCVCGFAQWSVMCMRARARAHACVCVRACKSGKESGLLAAARPLWRRQRLAAPVSSHRYWMREQTRLQPTTRGNARSSVGWWLHVVCRWVMSVAC
jgi:hypothetical protein